MKGIREREVPGKKRWGKEKGTAFTAISSTDQSATTSAEGGYKPERADLEKEIIDNLGLGRNILGES